MKEIILRTQETLIIRDIEVQDAAKIIQYVKLVATESDNLTFGPGEFDISLKQEEMFIREVLHKKNSRFVVAEIEGEIVGLADIQCGSRPRIQHTGELGLSVRKSHWHLGIGEAIMRFLLEWAKETKIIRKVNLHVREDNIPAINLYKKLQFVEEGRISRNLCVNGTFYSTIAMGIHIN